MKRYLEVGIRPIQPSDEPLMVKFHRMLSDRTVYLRYFCSVSLAARTAHKRLSRICFADGEHEVVLVAIYGEPESGEKKIVGVGRINISEDGQQGEMAVLIADDYQGRGVATQLLTNLVALARAKGVKQLTAEMLRDNTTMQAIFKRFGFRLRTLSDFRSVAANIEL